MLWTCDYHGKTQWGGASLSHFGAQGHEKRPNKGPSVSLARSWSRKARPKSGAQTPIGLRPTSETHSCIVHRPLISGNYIQLIRLPSCSFFWEGLRFKVNQPIKDVLFSHAGHLIDGVYRARMCFPMSISLLFLSDVSSRRFRTHRQAPHGTERAMSILVTGSAGHLGEALCRHYQEHFPEIPVVGVDRFLALDGKPARAFLLDSG